MTINNFSIDTTGVEYTVIYPSGQKGAAFATLKSAITHVTKLIWISTFANR